MGVEVTVPRDLWPRRGDWRGRVVRVFVREGDRVSRGDQLAEIEIEKAVLVIESETEGVVEKVYVRPGDTVGPGDAILRISG